MKRLLFLIALACVFGWPINPQGNPWHVSMIRLIADPAGFSSKQVAVIGFIHFGREGDLLYPHYEDYLHGILENSIRVRRTSQMARDEEHLDGNYVQVVGTFVSEAPGSIPSGTILDITRCVLWSEINNPRSKKMEGIHLLPQTKQQKN